MVPSSVRHRVYWAAPGSVRRSRSLERACWRVSWAPSPRTSTLPRWGGSNTPTRPRTAWCSDMVPWYWMGMSQPAKAPILAPRRRWTASSGEGGRPGAPARPGGRPGGGGGGGGGGVPRHPVGGALLEAGVVGPHPLRVADDLHVVDGQLELLGHLADHLGG